MDRKMLTKESRRRLAEVLENTPTEKTIVHDWDLSSDRPEVKHTKLT